MENKNDMFNKAPKNNKQKMFKFNLYWMYGLIFIMLFALYLTNDSSASKELGWTRVPEISTGKRIRPDGRLQQKESG